MKQLKTVAVLGSTGYVGVELVKILTRHPNVEINFLGCESSSNLSIDKKSFFFNNKYIPDLDLNTNFKPQHSDIVFLALPHGISHKFVKKFYNKIKIIDLSADFRLDSENVYSDNYNLKHSCPELLSKFIYGLSEINKDIIKINSRIAVPGCYPTSIVTPLIPLLKDNLIKTNNIIIDSKSGYSGAGKKFDIKNIKNDKNYNFYNYNTNQHRHICEIYQELSKHSKNKINFSFNPHILPIFRGMMSTIYCDMQDGFKINDLINTLKKFANRSQFVNYLQNHERADFFSIQNTNKLCIKLYKQPKNNKVIIVSLIDNLIKGAAGQAVQCFNIIYGFDEKIALI